VGGAGLAARPDVEEIGARPSAQDRSPRQRGLQPQQLLEPRVFDLNDTIAGITPAGIAALGPTSI
jgi:hypothetical protein